MSDSNKKLPDLEQFMKEVHEVARLKGWWTPGDHKSPLECMMLMASEISEAAEEVRKDTPSIYQVQHWGHGMPDDIVTPDEDAWHPALKPDGQAVELADCVLRILDYCQFHNLPLIQAMLLKNEYNKTRSYRHGKKL